MPTLKFFKDIPDFPSNIEVAHTPIIPLKDLQSNSEKESKNVFKAAKEHGYFLLDLQGSENGEKLLKEAEVMFGIGKKTFDLGREALMKHLWHPPRSLRGYKPAATFKTENGKFDNIEVYNLDQDDILNDFGDDFKDPEPLENHKKESQSFLRNAHAVLVDVLSHLDRHLGLLPGTLAGRCPLNKPSASSVRLLLRRPNCDSAEPSTVTLAGHTDIGLITMLFNVVSGLQVLPDGSENIPSNWKFVKPQLGCVMFQVADTLVQLTGGVLKSVVHRVVTPPGEHALLLRRSLAYFVRVENEASMRRLKGKGNVIPLLSIGEEDEETKPLDWADKRVNLVIAGKMEPWGGKSGSKVDWVGGS